MTHFTVGVMVPTTADRETVSWLLEPFYENLEVPEHDEPCWCINQTAETYGREMANKLVGTLRYLKDEFHDAHTRLYAVERTPDVDEKLQLMWTEHIRTYIETEDEYAKSHPLAGKPDPQCTECLGTGIRRTTSNPQAKWDWWTIGGRWNDAISGNRQNALKLLELDHIPVRSLITPDGNWHQKGNIGWFGMSWGDKTEEDWDNELRCFLNTYARFDVVLVDAHI